MHAGLPPSATAAALRDRCRPPPHHAALTAPPPPPGANDLCPAAALRPSDMLFPRAGFALHKMLTKQMAAREAARAEARAASRAAQRTASRVAALRAEAEAEAEAEDSDGTTSGSEAEAGPVRCGMQAWISALDLLAWAEAELT